MNWKKTTAIIVLMLSTVLLIPDLALAASEEPLGKQLPIWSIVPFVGMLLSIAIIPLVNAHWWEEHMLKVSLGWAALFFIPFWIAFGTGTAIYEFLHAVVLDYIPFIVLLFGLFTASGGIILRGTLKGRPSINVLMLTIGTVLASWIGTTGASMLLIRPIIRANAWRKKKAHIIIFFIFLIANIGGALTPIGDPPLFLGFLRGVPFFWTMKLLPSLIFNSVILLGVYYLIDLYYYKKETQPEEDKDVKPEPLRVDGLQNLIYVGMIVGAVILSGILPKTSLFTDLATGQQYGITLFEHHGHPILLTYADLLRNLIILLAAFLSLKTTSKAIRDDNHFTWGPIKEVASLFIGIFITMIPALAILNARGAELGIASPAQFFWATGLLSSFLDNAPTYLVFLSTGAALGATSGVATTLGTVAPEILMAVSMGAVFMGANTYIGNAPNFMVRSIAEENQIKMPSFFGYMGWSLLFLIPLFILDTIIFF